MIGDKVLCDDQSLKKAQAIYYHLKPETIIKSAAPIITIGGISGCQKTEIATDLREIFHKVGIGAIIISTDSYYKIAWTYRPSWRQENLKEVGPNEYDWRELKQTISTYKNLRSSTITAWDLDKYVNAKWRNIMPRHVVDVMIIEGLYANDPRIDSSFRVHIEASIKSTKNFRLKRMKEDENDVFRKQILEIEAKQLSLLCENIDLKI